MTLRNLNALTRVALTGVDPDCVNTSAKICFRFSQESRPHRTAYKRPLCAREWSRHSQSFSTSLSFCLLTHSRPTPDIACCTVDSQTMHALMLAATYFQSTGLPRLPDCGAQSLMGSAWQFHCQDIRHPQPRRWLLGFSHCRHRPGCPAILRPPRLCRCR